MSAIDNARAALERHDEFMGVEAGEGFNPVENPAWTHLREMIAEHERLTAEREWEYGWVANFENGEQYEWLDCGSREEAERQIALFRKREDARTEPDHLTYSLRRRLVTKSGPWEPVHTDRGL